MEIDVSDYVIAGVISQMDKDGNLYLIVFFF
jgi:hypothetical protein